MTDVTQDLSEDDYVESVLPRATSVGFKHHSERIAGLTSRMAAGCWFASVLLSVALGTIGRHALANEPIDVKVLVLNFDPCGARVRRAANA